MTATIMNKRLGWMWFCRGDTGPGLNKVQLMSITQHRTFFQNSSLPCRNH
ncbi:Uncharacterized protein APZ42_021163 [Daphnia magna]|uniref:Uncharacterized protein n=1 Tax=Daphnia magna TaxID=35525 RepID=A0A0N8CBB8_9CRUS|nr:Uncharacterized protein APZ42_021163 [Daphnia magna]